MAFASEAFVTSAGIARDAIGRHFNATSTRDPFFFSVKKKLSCDFLNIHCQQTRSQKLHRYIPNRPLAAHRSDYGKVPSLGIP